MRQTAMKPASILAAAIAALVCLALERPVQAADAALTTAQLEKAQAAHDRGIALRRTDPAGSMQAFRDAAREWEWARQAGAENGAIEFNLGNAYLESGDLGRAIAAYLRAERFMPGNADLAHNLAEARGMVSSSFDRGGTTMLVDSVARWWHLVPHGTRTALAWSCWLVFWGIVAARALAGVRPTHGMAGAAWRTAFWASLGGWVLFGSSLVADEALSTSRPRAVLLEAGTTLRKGNGDGFEPAFVETLGPGVECTVLEERPGWLRLELPDGRSGWVRANQAERT
jgi:hypothetical protein